MPNYNNSGDDLYSDGPAQASGPSGPAGGEEMDEGGTTATLPKSMFQNKSVQPGDEFMFEVVRVHEDEVEVRYSTGKGGGEEKVESKDGSTGEMESLMTD